MKNDLTEKQKRYAEARAAGMSQASAYAAAGYGSGSTRKTRAENACKLEQIEKVRKQVEYLRALSEARALDSTEERRAALVDIYQTSNNEKTRLKAIDLLNRMSGDYVDRREISATVSGISREDRKQAMAEALQALRDAWKE